MKRRLRRTLTGCWLLPIVALAAAPAAAEELLVCSFSSDRVSRFDAEGGFLGTLQLGVGLDGPLAARIGPDGLLYVASEESNSVQRYDVASGAFVDTFVQPGSGGLAGPSAVTWGPDGELYVASFDSDAILRYDGASGAFLGPFATTGAGGMNGPDNGTIFGPDGNLYVPSYWNNRIIRFNGQTGVAETLIAAIARPRVLEFRGDELLITSERSDSVRKYDAASGAYLGDLVAPGAGGLDSPAGMAFDEHGRLLVASVSNDNVLRFDGQSGAFIDEFIPPGVGGLDGPVFLTTVPEPGCLAGSVLIVGVVARAARRRGAKAMRVGAARARRRRTENVKA